MFTHNKKLELNTAIKMIKYEYIVLNSFTICIFEINQHFFNVKHYSYFLHQCMQAKKAEILLSKKLRSEVTINSCSESRRNIRR